MDTPRAREVLQIDLVMRAPAAAGGSEHAFVRKILRVAGGCGFRCAGDGHVFLALMPPASDKATASSSYAMENLSRIEALFGSAR